MCGLQKKHPKHLFDTPHASYHRFYQRFPAPLPSTPALSLPDALADALAGLNQLPPECRMTADWGHPLGLGAMDNLWRFRQSVA